MYSGRRDQRRDRGRLSLVLVVVLAAVASVLVGRDLAAVTGVHRTVMAAGTSPVTPAGRAISGQPLTVTTRPSSSTTLSKVAPPTPPPSAAPVASLGSTVPPAPTAPTTADTVPHVTAAPTSPTTSRPAATATPAIAAATTSAGYGCAAALAYLEAHAAPGFTFECPGNALGHQAMTCSFVAGVCPNSRIIAIADPCPAAYMNEAYNSRVAEGLAPGPFDPYGYCHN